MGVGIYYFYHGFGLKAFEGRHIRISYISQIGVAYYITSRKVCSARGIEKGNNFVHTRLYTSKL